jgi:hypothetical protein
MKKAEFDSPWKVILDTYLQDFMMLCFPKVAAIVDWAKGYTSLDQELHRMMKNSKVGKRYVDKLMKVWLKSGEEVCVFLHIEIQNQKEPLFPERLFTYYYRLFDYYKEPVITLAVLTDKNKSWRPTHYRHALGGCQIELQFPMVKLLDYRSKIKTLEKMKNPFSTVVLAHLAALDTQEDAQSRFLQKVALTRRLYRKGWSKQEIIDFYIFLDYIMALPPEFELQYNNEIERIEEKQNVRYITGMERIGIEKGVVQGETKVLLRQLQHKFGQLTPRYRTKLKEANSNMLLALADRVLDAHSLEEVFAES